MTNRIIFLGGIFLPSQMGQIQENSRGVVQNAADALQKSLIRGISGLCKGRTALVNLPFVGSYPQRYKKWVFPPAQEIIYDDVKAIGAKFVNVRFIRTAARFLASIRGLRPASGGRSATIVVYSAHLPFLAAALLHARFTPGTTTCLVLPDFPEFMGEGGVAYRAAKRVECSIFYALAKRVDHFVVLTRFMAERLRLQEGRYVVVEGIYDPEGSPDGELGWSEESGTVFLYTGTLAARYGILDLLEAFRSLDNLDARLWICGAGDSEHAVRDAARADPRIHYFGQVSRQRALQLQNCAHILVNPRRPEGEFTKFSFPSKTMEYLGAGRPVVMHWLPGIPEEYLPHLSLPPTPDMAGLGAAMRDISVLPVEELRRRGQAGRDFIMREKTPLVQCARIVELVGAHRCGVSGTE